MISMNDLGFEGLKLGKTNYLHVIGPSIQSFHSVRKTGQDDDTQYYVGTIGT